MALSEMNYVESKIAQIDYNYVKSVVDSHTNTYNFTTLSDRANITDGGVYVDVTNKMIYLYADYTALKTETPSSNSFNTMIMFGATSYEYDLVPCSSSASVPNKVIIIESTTATNDPVINLYPYSSDNSIRIGHTKKYTVGENFKVWAVWSIRTA